MDLWAWSSTDMHMPGRVAVKPPATRVAHMLATFSRRLQVKQAKPTHAYALRRGFAYSGALSRMRRVVHDMVLGKPVRIEVIGGSITADCANNKRDNWWVLSP